MQRLKAVILALMAAFALSAVMSATTASAAVEVLGIVGASETFTGEYGSGTFETTGGSKVACEKGKYEGTIEPKTGEKEVLGLFHVEIEGCKSSGFSCTGLDAADASGVILALGTYHLVNDKLTPNEVGFLYLLEPVHLTCFIALVAVTGENLCLIKPINEKTKHAEIKCDQTKGVPSELTYWDEAGTEVKLSEKALETSKNEGAAEGAGLSTTGLILTTEELTIDA